jgi:hypothetical protein
MTSPSCEYDDCSKPIVGYVDASWSIADFVRYEGCDEHLWEMREQLRHRRVEGRVPTVSLNYYLADDELAG